MGPTSGSAMPCVKQSHGTLATMLSRSPFSRISKFDKLGPNGSPVSYHRLETQLWPIRRLYFLDLKYNIAREKI
jgi:hypothetical protein